MNGLTTGNKIDLGFNLAGLIAQLFLNGHDADKAKAIGAQVGGIAEQIADLVATAKQ